MKDGFIKIASATPDIRVADTEYNTENIINDIYKAASAGAKLIVFPELCITGYTCGDLFLQDALLSGAKKGLESIIEKSRGLDMMILAGLPVMKDAALYNVAAVVKDGRLLGFVPKKHLPAYSEFYESRIFKSADDENSEIYFSEEFPEVPFGTDIIFEAENMPKFRLSAEICEDLWVPAPPSVSHSLAGATIIANLSASDETTGKSFYRHELVRMASASQICVYVYSDAGEGESSTDLVFSGDDVIGENGTILNKSKPFENGIIYAVADLGKVISERRRIRTFHDRSAAFEKTHRRVSFRFEKIEETDLKLRFTDRAPFVPSSREQRDRRSEEIINIQAMGLKKRLVHTHAEHAVIGISGGLDSTLALLVTARAFDLAGIPRENIIAVTMPCFGTTDRTYRNAVSLTKELGAQLKEIRINEAVTLHFREIGQDPSDHSVTYENSQARYRTLLLMDIANKNNGMVVGTGDLSELALGWATYNGDHMSMYGVNCSVPKTLVRYLVLYFAETCGRDNLKKLLLDILATPVSPELLPPENGKISQKTESLVGPYELHDFFLYYCMRFGYMPHKIYRLARSAFEGIYDDATILKWLKSFYRRFFAQQFKRSCLPDGPKVGSVALSPRGDWRMPSDAVAALWQEDLEEIKVPRL